MKEEVSFLRNQVATASELLEELLDSASLIEIAQHGFPGLEM